MAWELVVAGFSQNSAIPRSHTCEGADLSPAIEWKGAPETTQSFALIVDDPDAPGRTWNHWLLYDISPSVHSLDPGFEPGMTGVSGTNDFGKLGYNGPCPPRGHGPHRYFFKLYALDVPSLKLSAGARRAQLDKAMRGHVLAEAQYVGRYERK